MIELTYYGHSSFLVEINGKKLLFDPFIRPNEKASNISVSDIKADYVLITHGHEDHVCFVVVGCLFVLDHMIVLMECPCDR